MVLILVQEQRFENIWTIFQTHKYLKENWRYFYLKQLITASNNSSVTIVKFYNKTQKSVYTIMFHNSIYLQIFQQCYTRVIF